MCSYCVKIFNPLILEAPLRPFPLANFEEGMLIDFGQSSLIGHHLCIAGLFLVRGGIFLCHYCCLHFSNWMAVRFKKIRSDVMFCGMLSSTASLSEAGNMTASAVTLRAWEPLYQHARTVNMLRVEQFAKTRLRITAEVFFFFFFFYERELLERHWPKVWKKNI